MEEKKTVFDYLGQILMIFGFTMLTLNVFCLAFGDSAEEFSAIFQLGSRGISVETAFQFLCISSLITGVRFLFFTDTFIKKMPVALRTVCMLTAVVAIIVIFVIAFHWFPADMWQPWAMFLLCFGISFLGSCLVMAVKEKTENRRMREALEKLKNPEKQKERSEGGNG